MRAAGLGVMVLVWITAGTSARSQGASPVTAFTRPLSPSVLGTFTIREHQVQLLVLWRDAPGWFLRQGERSEAYGGGPARFTASLRYSGVQLDLLHDAERRVATVAGIDVPLTARQNVIMIDHVAGPAGQRTARSVAVDLRTQDPLAAPADILRRSAEIQEFLRCEAASGPGMAFANAGCENVPPR
jgi:hypothetical protein